MPHYTAWRQRHKGLNNLPKDVTQQHLDYRVVRLLCLHPVTHHMNALCFRVISPSLRAWMRACVRSIVRPFILLGQNEVKDQTSRLRPYQIRPRRRRRPRQQSVKFCPGSESPCSSVNFMLFITRHPQFCDQSRRRSVYARWLSFTFLRICNADVSS